MTNLDPQQFGKLILLLGIVTSIIGIAVILLGKMGLFKLPGDIEFEGKTWKVYLPIATCIVISILLTVIIWLIKYFKK